MRRRQAIFAHFRKFFLNYGIRVDLNRVLSQIRPLFELYLRNDVIVKHVQCAVLMSTSQGNKTPWAHRLHAFFNGMPNF